MVRYPDPRPPPPPTNPLFLITSKSVMLKNQHQHYSSQKPSPGEVASISNLNFHLNAVGERCSGEKYELGKSALLCLLLLGTLVGCAVHVWHISVIYFGYPTSTSVSIFTELEPYLPAITLCMYLKDTFNRSRLEPKIGRYKYRGEPIPPLLTIAEINEMGIDMDEIIGGVYGQFFGAPEERIEWRPSSTSIHVARDLKCLTLFGTSWEVRRGAKGRLRLRRGTLLKIKLLFYNSIFVDHDDYETLYRVYVHDPYENVGEVLYGTSFEIGVGHSVIVKVQNLRSILLPAPYDTNCLNYTHAKGFATQADCICNCVLSKWIEQGGGGEPWVWPYDVSIRLDTPKYNWSSLYLSQNASFALYGQCHREECAQVDCLQHFISLGLVLDKVEEINGNGSASLFVWLPTEPSYTYFHSPKMETVEYVCYLGSVISLWFGLSVLTALTSIRRFCTDATEASKLKP